MYDSNSPKRLAETNPVSLKTRACQEVWVRVMKVREKARTKAYKGPVAQLNLG
jgi:hypothetical protein